jgi:hypothetical protein
MPAADFPPSWTDAFQSEPQCRDDKRGRTHRAFFDHTDRRVLDKDRVISSEAVWEDGWKWHVQLAESGLGLIQKRRVEGPERPVACQVEQHLCTSSDC